MSFESLSDFQIPEPYYTMLFEAMPGQCLLVKADAPKFTILAATPAYLAQTGYGKASIIGNGVVDVFTANSILENAGNENLLSSLQHVIKYKEPPQLPLQQFTMKSADGNFIEKEFKAFNTPVLSPDGEVVYIIHSVEAFADNIKAEQHQKITTKENEKAYHVFMNAPVIIGVLKGDDYIIELANEGLLEVWGRTEDVIGKPLLTAIPELQAQGFISLLDQVRTTGNPFYAYEFPITLNRHGNEEVFYFDFVYKPIYDEENSKIANGIISVGHDVTAQVTARKAVQESQAKYQNLFESMDQGFCVLEMIFENENQPVDYRFLEVNPVFEQQTGLVDAVGKTALELVPNLERHWLELYGRVVTTGQSIRFTQGSEAMKRWFDVFAFCIDEKGSNKLALLFTDISERRKAEEALKQSETNLRNMILQAPVAMAILKGPRFVIEIANDHMYELWGRGKDELHGKSIFEGLPEVRNQGFEELLTGVYTTGKRFSALGSPVILPRDGVVEMVYINFLYEAFREADGTISGVMAVASDVTEQVRARIKVEESHKELRFAIDVMPQMVWITKPDGYHDMFNRQWYQYTGLPHEVTKGEGWSSVLHPDDEQRAWQLWRHSLQTGEPYEIEYRIRRYDGVYKWFLGRALPLKDEAGKITKWFGTCTDVDDQRKAAEIMEQRIKERTEALHKSNQDLSRSNQNLEEFAYAASHDLKEPMRKIQLFSGRLMDDLSDRLNEAEKGYLNRIIKATDRMNTLIDDLLMYSHVNRGAELEERVDLNQKVARVLEDLEVEIEERNAVIRVDNLPTIIGHRRQLQQLFQNLISNAIKYHKQGVQPEVDIKCRKLGDEESIPVATDKPKDQYYLIEVTDNGIGFEQEHAERIFNVFTRLHGNAEYKGTGVGLSIARKVVENHGGYIWAQGTPGLGAKFLLLLPVA